MKIDSERHGGAAQLRLEGRLDREWSERLSDTIEDLLQDGVRSLKLDFAGVSYVSTAATRMLTAWRQELAVLRGQVELLALPPDLHAAFSAAGWGARTEGSRASSGALGLRRSSWHAPGALARCGSYEFSESDRTAAMRCHLSPVPGTKGTLTAADCEVIPFPADSFGLGLGAIGENFEEGRGRIGELVSVAGCVACYPSDGARLPDYLVAEDGVEPRALLAAGLTCRGGFSHLMRFSTQPESEEVPLSELAAVALDAVGGGLAGLVIAGETAGIAGARIRRSPAAGDDPLRFEIPAVRDWLSFAAERTHATTTTLIAGVAARKPKGAIAPLLLPLDGSGDLFGHFHAAVFSYHPLPQRTVELGTLVRGLFANHLLRDVLHLVGDDRGEAGVGETALLRGVCWISPITPIA